MYLEFGYLQDKESNRNGVIPFAYYIDLKSFENETQNFFLVSGF